jgi:uncharacterized protein (DUF885 family)
MRWQLRLTIQRYEHHFHQWGGFSNMGVDHMEGFQSWMPSIVESAQPMKNQSDAKALIRRIKALPEYVRNQINNLSEGVASNRVAAQVPVQRTLRQLEEIIAGSPSHSPLVAAAARLPKNIRAIYRKKLEDVVKSSAVPAYRAYSDYLKKYVSNARTDESPGLCALPGGIKAYKHLIEYFTSLKISPEELHAIGHEELRQIHGEMAAVAQRMGHKGTTASFMDKVRQDPKNFFRTREEIVQSAKDFVERTFLLLPRYFGTLPQTPLVVKPIESYLEKNDVGARYTNPPNDLSQPGIYYINTYAPSTRPKFSMASLTAHEGVPGHHLQIALAVENRDLPTFQRYAESTAFKEGWALYCERLADEMGLYKDDLSRIGMLSDQAFRACRLVVDTGLHAMGWSRQQTIAFMKENTPMSEGQVISEVDRYMIWPGQALAYKVGQRAIVALRTELQEKLGPSFDIKKFHDALLSHGPLPLTVMRQTVLRQFLG